MKPSTVSHVVQHTRNFSNLYGINSRAECVSSYIFLYICRAARNPMTWKLSSACSSDTVNIIFRCCMNFRTWLRTSPVCFHISYHISSSLSKDPTNVLGNLVTKFTIKSVPTGKYVGRFHNSYHKDYYKIHSCNQFYRNHLQCHIVPVRSHLEDIVHIFCHTIDRHHSRC